MEQTKVYAARLLDRTILSESSSGGAFVALSNVFLSDNNAVVCATYDYDSNNTVFKIVETKKERDEARGSKYIQAKMGMVYRESEKWLINHPDKKILFFGMGCQAASFQRYMELRKLSSRIVSVDIICHGVPSPAIWKDYIHTISKGKGITFVNFRNKKTGWQHSVGTAIINGREESIQTYRKLYSTRNITRPSCYFCPYTTIERSSDMTIGDYWHIEKVLPEFYDSSGVSLVIIHTKTGQKLFDQAKSEMEFIESNSRDCLQYNLEKPTMMPDSRSTFWKEYWDKGIEYIIHKYGLSDNLIYKAHKKTKSCLAKIGLLGQ